MDHPNFDKEWNYSKPEETREKFLKILEESQGTAELDYVLQLKTQIARTFSLQLKIDRAHAVLDEVEGKLNETTKIANIRYHLERGRTFNSDGKKDKAKALFIDAYNASRAAGQDNFTIDAAHMVGIAAGSFDEKLQWNQKGLDAALESNNTKVKGWVGVFYNNMGWDLFEHKRYDEALVMFKKCWDFHLERESEKQAGIAKWSYAKTLRLLGKVDESLNLQRERLKEEGGTDSSGYISEELGELYLLKGAKEESAKYFAQAYEKLSQDAWLHKNEKERLDRIKQLSQ